MESYPSAEKQSVYSTAPADWAIELKNKPRNKVNKYALIAISEINPLNRSPGRFMKSMCCISLETIMVLLLLKLNEEIENYKD